MRTLKNTLALQLILLFTLVSFTVKAQIEVHDGGRVSMGGNPGGSPAAQVFINSAVSGHALYVEGNTSSSTAVEVDGSTNGPYSLYVSHKNTTSNTCAIQSLVPNSGCNSYGLDVTGGSSVFYVTGTGAIFLNGGWITSDSSLKRNITLLSGSLEQLDKIHGYNYHYRQDVILEKGVEKGKKFIGDTALHAGLMAYEVQRIAPYAVREMKNGKLAIDYIQLIPFLLQGIHELDSINKQQDAQLNLLQSRFNALSTIVDSNSGHNKTSSTFTPKGSLPFSLYQNIPNPFNKETSIAYSLNGNYASAYIYIFDLQGGLKKSYKLDNSGSILVKSNELSAGMYLYSLVVDGNQIDMKKMLLTN